MVKSVWLGCASVCLLPCDPTLANTSENKWRAPMYEYASVQRPARSPARGPRKLINAMQVTWRSLNWHVSNERWASWMHELLARGVIHYVTNSPSHQSPVARCAGYSLYSLVTRKTVTCEEQKVATLDVKWTKFASDDGCKMISLVSFAGLNGWLRRPMAGYLFNGEQLVTRQGGLVPRATEEQANCQNTAATVQSGQMTQVTIPTMQLPWTRD